jgi:hypothetical protein
VNAVDGRARGKALLSRSSSVFSDGQRLLDHGLRMQFSNLLVLTTTALVILISIAAGRERYLRPQVILARACSPVYCLKFSLAYIHSNDGTATIIWKVVMGPKCLVRVRLFVNALLCFQLLPLSTTHLALPTLFVNNHRVCLGF